MLGRTLKLILDLGTRPAPAGPTAELDGLFAELAAAVPARPPSEIEDAIWDLWTHHPDALCDGLMAQAIAATAMRHVDDARAILSRLAAAAPDWAEAWYRQAALHAITGQDIEALVDLDRAIALEPRHFGAIARFGHIALRHGDLAAAQAAFEVALGIHPHLQDIRLLATEIGRGLPHTLN